MALLDLPNELILLVAVSLPESDLFRLLQVHRSLYSLVLPLLYQRHLRGNNNKSQEAKGPGIFWCTATGNVAAVQHFLRYGADVNAFITNAALIWRGRANIPSSCCSCSFLPWHSTQTPLNIASNLGNDELVSLLLNHGANVNGFPDQHHLPKGGGGGGGVRRTVQPAVVDALLSGHESTVRLLLKHGSPLHDPGMERGGLVNCAISRGQLSLLRMLVCEFGADVNVTWQEGVYPLNRAVSSSGERAAEIVRFLLDNGADIGLANGGGGGNNEDGEDTGGHRLLNQAIRHGTIDTLRLLFDRGVVVATTQPLDNNIFRTWVVERCTVDAMRLLHEHGWCAPDIQDTLLTVIRARRADILQLFIDSGVDLNTKTARGGSTLLHAAVVRCRSYSETPLSVCSRGHRPMPFVSTMVRRIEPDPQQQVSTARCCMSDKVEKCAPDEIVRCLIQGGADVNALDVRGLSPLALAEKAPLVVRQMLVDGGGK
jgi:ankyrin repeat protein